jgi:hypothetical protein
MLRYKNSYKFCQQLFERVLIDKHVQFIVFDKQWVMRVVLIDDVLHFQFLRDIVKGWITVASVKVTEDTHTTLLTVNTDYQGIIDSCNQLIKFMMKNIRHNGSKWLID